MKKTLVNLILFVGSVVALITLVNSCASEQAKQAHDTFLQAYTEAVSDDVITEAEAEHLKDLWGLYVSQAKEDVANFDWRVLAGTALAGVITLLTGIRVMPNSLILGKQAADKLK